MKISFCHNSAIILNVGSLYFCINLELTEPCWQGVQHQKLFLYYCHNPVNVSQRKQEKVLYKLLTICDLCNHFFFLINDGALFPKRILSKPLLAKKTCLLCSLFIFIGILFICFSLACKFSLTNLYHMNNLWRKVWELQWILVTCRLFVVSSVLARLYLPPLHLVHQFCYVSLHACAHTCPHTHTHTHTQRKKVRKRSSLRPPYFGCV